MSALAHSATQLVGVPAGVGGEDDYWGRHSVGEEWRGARNCRREALGGFASRLAPIARFRYG